MRIKRVLIFIIVLCGFSAQAQNSALLQSFTQELQSKSTQVSTIKCSFTQVRSVSVLATDVVKRGKFFFAKPNNILLLFDDGDHIKMTAEWFEMKMGGNVSRMKIAANPMLKNLGSLLSACMVGDFEQMARGFEIGIEQGAKEWVVAMTPMRGKAAARVSQIELRFDRGDMSLNSLKMEERSGDYTLYTFSNKTFNKVVESEIFNIAQ